MQGSHLKIPKGMMHESCSPPLPPPKKYARACNFLPKQHNQAQFL